MLQVLLISTMMAGASVTLEGVSSPHELNFYKPFELRGHEIICLPTKAERRDGGFYYPKIECAVMDDQGV